MVHRGMKIILITFLGGRTLSFHASKRSYSRADRCRAVTATAASVVAMMVAMPMTGNNVAHAQDQSAQAPSIEQIVVTGSRIVRDGFEAPTPVSVLGIDDLNQIAVPNIADAVNRLPALQRSLGTTNASTNVSSGTGGVSNLNLRALGAVRTLVLLDGKRVVGASLAGFENNGSVPDINGFPGGLVSRVDVVTGGASAIYGSDALAGVVNFVLDREYTGVKGEVSGGVSTFGDNRDFKLSLAAGTPFANGRGHFLFFGEFTYTPGVVGSERPYNEISKGIFSNPAWLTDPTAPQYIMADRLGSARSAPGGLILGDNVNGSYAGPLRGIQFLEGGLPDRLTFGALGYGRTTQVMQGGDWEQTRYDRYPTLALEVQRTNFFTRGSYDVTDNINVYAEASWAYTRATNHSVVPSFRQGNITVQSDNVFIPDHIQDIMSDGGISTLKMGSWLQGGPEIGADNSRHLRRYVGGIEGDFTAMDTDWSWDAYYSRSGTHNATRSPGNILNKKFVAASDAVSDGNGSAICRSTLTNPNDGCVPYNVFGIGVNGQAAHDYVSSTGYAMTVLTQDVFAASVTGEPVSTWAGPVSIAVGGEYRIEKVKGLASADDLARNFFAGNYSATQAKYNVAEGFIEAVVPLARDQDWAESLEFNAAYRATSYSESGFVSTYKVGMTYTPIDDITIRATRSRDIRAPNLGDLFNKGRFGTGGVDDPVLGTSYTVVSGVVGNPNAKPEKADTTGVGIVIRPSFIPGFQASLDYYNINIKGALQSLSTQAQVDRCNAGSLALCLGIDRDAGTNEITVVRRGPENILSQKTDGIDFEFSYGFPMDAIFSDMGGDISLRGMANYTFHLTSDDPDPLSGTTKVEGAGVLADSFGLGGGIGINTPQFTWTTSATYAVDAFSATLTYRGTGSGKINNAYIQCKSACPVSTLAATTIDDNSVPSEHIFDLGINYKVFDDTMTLFFNSTNLLNTPPPRIGGGRSSYYGGMSNDNYDRIGRMFRAGVRFTY
jgi:iron complex outermembrane receptor protein